MKKGIAILSMLVLCLSLAGTGTLAYFTDEKQVHNIITTHGVKIELEEWQETPEGRIPYPDQPIPVLPGGTVSKIVTIRNLEAESFIRARVKILIKNAQGNVMELEQDELEPIVHLDWNDKGWLKKENDDGWYYYKDSVEGDSVTEPLFENVRFDGPNMDNEFANGTIDIIVYAQAVQTANNSGGVLNVAGWPEE